MSDKYRCAACGEVFDKAWSDEEAVAEAERLFGDVTGEFAVVCDDCWQRESAKWGEWNEA